MRQGTGEGQSCKVGAIDESQWNDIGNGVGDFKSYDRAAPAKSTIVNSGEGPAEVDAGQSVAVVEGHFTNVAYRVRDD